MVKRRQERSSYQQINIKLLNDEEFQLYWDIRAIATEHRQTLHDFVMEMFREKRKQVRGK